MPETPELTAAEKARLPAWAEPHPGDANAVLVDPDQAYPALLQELGFKEATRYAVEVAYQCMKMDLQAALRRYNFTIHVRADDGRKERWALAALPGGALDVVRATKGLEAKQHYRRIRGFVPG